MRHRLGLWVGILAVTLLVSGAARAQAPAETPSEPAPPTLSEVDRLRLQNAILAVELAELRRTQAIADAQRVLQALQVPGYTLDLERLVYVPVAPPEAPTP
jgi:hypothetical protein